MFYFMQPRLLICAALSVLLAACSADSVIPDRRPDYRSSASANPLEVPPDLTSSTIDDTLVVPELNPSDSANLSDYERERQGLQLTSSETVLVARDDMRIERDGERRWLVINAPADVIWPRVKEFWTSNGFPLTRDDPRIGIMETDWLENRADIPDGPVRAVFKQFLDFAYSAPTRDKFRVRLERLDAENTEVYLTHYGVEEILTSPSGSAPSAAVANKISTTTQWQNRPRDPELEVEMLNRLMVYLGATEQRAQAALQNADSTQPMQAEVIRNEAGQQALLIKADYDRSWRLVGLALDTSSFVVEDQNRSAGLYVVEYRDAVEDARSDGLLSQLAFWRDDEPREEGERYRVRLAGQGPQTLIVVHDLQGQPSNTPAAQFILDNIRQAIR